MKMRIKRIVLASCLLSILIPSESAIADVFVFNDESSYLAMVATLGFQAVHEGFEDDAAWGTVRSTFNNTHSAPSITNLGITWTSNNDISQVTTGSGAARTGQWGFYTLPHGDPPDIGDGFIGTSKSPIYGVGGWIRTNTPPARISLWLEIGLPGEMEVDFDGNDGLGTQYAFFGVIDTDGFTRFDYLETEFDIDELKYIFADDFTFAMPIVDQAEIVPDQLTVIRGIPIGGDITDVFASDDSYLKFNPGPTLIANEPPVWVEFQGTLTMDNPSLLTVTLESSANTVGIIQTVDAFNFTSGQYEEVDSTSASFNSDSVVIVDLTDRIADYVETGTGQVKTRTGWRSSGPILIFPWTIRIDQVVWNLTQ